jgi:hypothetical protein
MSSLASLPPQLISDDLWALVQPDPAPARGAPQGVGKVVNAEGDLRR